MNIAARLEQNSKPGSIYVSDSVKRNLENKTGISSSFVQEAALKNVKDPIKIYEITVDGQFLPDSLPDSRDFNQTKVTPNWKRPATIIALVGLVISLLILYLNPSFNLSLKETGNIQLPGNSIAVLPFENQGNDAAFDYLGTGFADGILTKLSMLNDFTIISRSSSFKFKKSDKSLSEIAELLNVSMILEGSYQVINDEIRINAKLVGVKDNKNLLAETYNGKVENIFKLQDQASNGLFNLLGKNGISASSKDSKSKNPISIEAFKYYQEGISLLKEEYVYKSGILESRILLQKALNKDPGYIEPLIALSESFLMEMFYGYNSIIYVKDSIEKYVSRANVINPDIGQLMTIRGAMNFYEYNMSEAERLIKKGIKLNPNYPLSYYFLSFMSVLNVNQYDKFHYINTAINLDPLNSAFQTTKILQSIFLLDFGTAESMIDNSLQKQPGDNMGLFLKGMMLNQQKKYQEALNSLLMRSVGDTTNFLVAYTYGMLGNTAMTEKITNVLIERENNYYISPTMIAIAYLGIGDHEKVLEWMEKAYIEKDSWYYWLLLTMFEPLYEDPRFIELMKKFNIYTTYQMLYDKVDE